MDNFGIGGSLRRMNLVEMVWARRSDEVAFLVEQIDDDCLDDMFLLEANEW